MKRLPWVLWGTFLLGGCASEYREEPSACADHVTAEVSLQDERGVANPASSDIAMRDDGNLMLVASVDTGALLLVDRDMAVQGSIPLDAEPGDVVFVSHSTAAVGLPSAGQVVLVDVEGARVLGRIPVGVEPAGLAVMDNGNVAVAVAGDSRLVVLNPATLAQVVAFPLGFEPVAVTQAGRGQLLVVPRTGGVGRLLGPTLDDPKSNVVVSGLQAVNTTVTRLPRLLGVQVPGDQPFFGRPGYYGDIMETGFKSDAVLDTGDSGVVVTDHGRPGVTTLNGGTLDGCGPPWNWFDGTGRGGHVASGVTAAAFVDGVQLVVSSGTHTVLQLSMNFRDSAAAPLRDVGQGVRGIVVTPDGKRAFVYSQFDHVMHGLTVPLLRNPPASDRSRQLFAPPPATPVGRGRVLFHDASNPSLTNTAVSCASCHPHGRDDHRNWAVGGDAMATPPLGGGILSSAPFHWEGNVADADGINIITVQGVMGGSGLDPDQLEDLMAFVDSLPAAPAPEVADAELVAAGKGVFESTAAGCTTCHQGSLFTDNKNHRLVLKTGVSNVQTPVLLGLGRSAPYLHDNSAGTLEEFVETSVRTDRMGHGSHLQDASAAALVAYLKSL